MKKLIIAVALGLATTTAFAQKTNVKSAEKLASSNPAEARGVIKQALAHDETKADAQAWFVAGLVEYQAFNADFKKLATGATVNTDAMYNALHAELPLWFKAIELDALPNEKGKVKPRYTAKIKEYLKEQFLSNVHINAAYTYLQKNEYGKSVPFLEDYLAIRKSPLFADDKQVSTPDTTLWDLTHLLSAVHYESKNYDKAIAVAEAAQDQPYKQSDIWQIRAASLLAKEDTTTALSVLQEGLRRFSGETFYLGNIVNIYARQGRTDDAIALLQKGIEDNPKDLNYIIALGGLYEQKEQFEKAGEIYARAVAIDAESFEANHNLGRAYYNQAVTLLNAEVLDRLTETKAKDLLRKALPYLEAAYKKEPAQVYYILANVYDRLDQNDKAQAIRNENL